MSNKYDFSGKTNRNAGWVIERASRIVASSTATGFLVLAVAGIAVTLVGCSPTASTQTPTSPAQAQISNSALEEKIKTNLNSDEQLRASNLAVTANADRNEATLSGTVQSESAKTKAVDSAKNAQAGLIVTSKIEVDPSCCGGMHGGPGMHGKEGMPGMKRMPGGEHTPPKN